MFSFFKKWWSEILMTILLSAIGMAVVAGVVTHIAATVYQKEVKQTTPLIINTKLPEKVMVVDRTNKLVITYNAYPKVDDGVLYILEASELDRTDISELKE